MFYAYADPRDKLRDSKVLLLLLLLVYFVTDNMLKQANEIDFKKIG